jgi:hypothetical protein
MTNTNTLVDSGDDNPVRDHPTSQELYEFFASHTSKLGVEQRQELAFHVSLCQQCAFIGTLIESAEEQLERQLSTVAPADENFSLEKSLAFVRTLAVRKDSEPTPRGLRERAQSFWIALRDFFYFRWGTSAGRLQLSGGVLAAIVLTVIGYCTYPIAISVVRRFKGPAEQLAKQSGPLPPPPAASPTPQAIVDTTERAKRLPKLADHLPQRQLLAHMSSYLVLNRLREGMYRGGGNKKETHLIIKAASHGPTSIHLKLPDGSPTGSYNITIEDAYFQPITKPARAQTRNGKDLVVSLDLRRLRRRICYLGVARENGAPLHYEVRLLRIDNPKPPQRRIRHED